MSVSSRSSRHRLPPQRQRWGGHRVALIGGLAIALAGGGWVAAAHAADDAGGTTAVAYLEGSLYDGAVVDTQLPVYRSGAGPGSLGVSARIALVADGTRPPTAAQLAQTARLRAAATARANQAAAAKAKATVAAKAAAKARTAARARAAAAARAAQIKAAAKKTAKKTRARKPVAVYRGDVTRSPAAMSSSRARAAISLRLWRASATARHVVKAESGGNCADVSANGKYHGCWQMSVGLWKGHGGLAFAARPELASCAEQDIVAYRIWVQQGWSPWSTA